MGASLHGTQASALLHVFMAAHAAPQGQFVRSHLLYAMSLRPRFWLHMGHQEHFVGGNARLRTVRSYHLGTHVLKPFFSLGLRVSGF
jgi:hypothetical protein